MGRRSGLLDGIGDDFAWSLLDASPDGIFVVADTGEIAFASDQASSLFGYAPDDLLGRSVDELLPEDLRARHRAHRTRYRAHPEVRSMGVGLELRARRWDGSEFHAEISLSPLALGDAPFVVAAVRDISDRVAAEDHLHRVLSTLDASDDGIFIFDADTLQYLHVNDGATRLVGYRRDELIAMSPVHLNPYSSPADYHELVDRLLADPTATAQRETRLLRKDGVEVPVEKSYRAAPSARDGSRWIVALARDITGRLASEAELAASEGRLREAEQAMILADDRDRIARDLHDTVIQRLFAAGLSLQSVSAAADDHVRARIERTVEDLDETIRELRTAIFSLQSPPVARVGPTARLLEVAGDARDALSFEPRIELEGPIDGVDEHVVEHLVPTLREALSNVAKHAQASSVLVSVTADAEALVLVVVDDGVGLRGEPSGGNGLNNLARRADKLGGASTIAPGEAGGVRLEWRVPLPGTTAS